MEQRRKFGEHERSNYSFLSAPHSRDKRFLIDCFHGDVVKLLSQNKEVYKRLFTLGWR